jgi:hypothetical protein
MFRVAILSFHHRTASPRYGPTRKRNSRVEPGAVNPRASMQFQGLPLPESSVLREKLNRYDGARAVTSWKRGRKGKAAYVLNTNISARVGERMEKS